VAFMSEHGSMIRSPKAPAQKQKGFRKGFKPLRVLEKGLTDLSYYFH
jgi:hypothetical protein